MNTTKKLSLKKETIVHLNKDDMTHLKGGGGSSFICDYVAEKVLDRALDGAEKLLKDNTWWVGCSTDPAKQTY